MRGALLLALLAAVSSQAPKLIISVLIDDLGLCVRHATRDPMKTPPTHSATPLNPAVTTLGTPARAFSRRTSTASAAMARSLPHFTCSLFARPRAPPSSPTASPWRWASKASKLCSRAATGGWTWRSRRLWRPSPRVGGTRTWWENPILEARAGGTRPRFAALIRFVRTQPPRETKPPRAQSPKS